jgi:hypothetical protein
MEHGLLMNFGAPTFEIRKYVLSRPGNKTGSTGLLAVLFSALAPFAIFRG